MPQCFLERAFLLRCAETFELGPQFPIEDLHAGAASAAVTDRCDRSFGFNRLRSSNNPVTPVACLLKPVPSVARGLGGA